MEKPDEPGRDAQNERECELPENGNGIERREFLKEACKWGGGLLLISSLGPLAASCGNPPQTVKSPGTIPRTTPAPGPSDLAVAHGTSPGELARKAVDSLGGMGRFVKSGDVVVVKVNASFLDGLKDATTTNPEVAAQVVAMCKEANAKRVIVMDHILCGTVEEGFGQGSGIGEAVENQGAEIIAYNAGDDGHGVLTMISGAKAMNSTSIYPEYLDADVVITVPKAKHHSGTGLSLGMKNFIGATAHMSDIHTYDTHQAIADLNTLVRPTLSVIDASVILMENGPGGPGATKDAGQVIASGDIVAADSYACTLFGMTAQDVPYITDGATAGLGNADYKQLKIAEV